MGLSRLSVMKAEAVKSSTILLFVDAAIAKRNLGTTIDMADYVIGLGPGFTAGVDVDVVIETKRGHRLGRIIREGRPLPIQVSRVLSAVMAKSVSFIPRMQVFSMVLPISEIW